MHKFNLTILIAAIALSACHPNDAFTQKLETEIAQLKTKLSFDQEQIDKLVSRLNSGVNIEEFTEEEQEFLHVYLSRQDVLGQ